MQRIVRGKMMEAEDTTAASHSDLGSYGPGFGRSAETRGQRRDRDEGQPAEDGDREDPQFVDGPDGDGIGDAATEEGGEEGEVDPPGGRAAQDTEPEEKSVEPTMWREVKADRNEEGKEPGEAHGHGHRLPEGAEEEAEGATGVAGEAEGLHAASLEHGKDHPDEHRGRKEPQHPVERPEGGGLEEEEEGGQGGPPALGGGDGEGGGEPAGETAREGDLHAPDGTGHHGDGEHDSENSTGEEEEGACHHHSRLNPPSNRRAR